MSRQLINRIKGRVYGWFDSKDAGPVLSSAPAKFGVKARLALDHLEDRTTPSTFTVLNNGDDGGVDPPAVPVLDGSDNGTGTLRQAIVNANTNPGPDTIVFNSAVNGQTIALLANLTGIADELTITGNVDGSNNKLITISGGGTKNIFNCTPAPAGTLITFDKLIITKGSQAGLANFSGGITISTQKVTLSNSTMTNNTADAGGGIRINAAGAGQINISNCLLQANTGTLGSVGGGLMRTTTSNIVNIDNSTIENNTSAFSGSGIYTASSTVTITNSLIRNNTAFGGGTGGRGAGIYAPNAVLNISNSRITGNTANSFGAGIYGNTGSKITLDNCTISNNSNNNFGGAGLMIRGSNLVSINNTTINNNSTSGAGGAISTFSDAGLPIGTWTITNSTITKNTAGSAAATGLGLIGGGAFSIAQSAGGTVTIRASTITGNLSNSTSVTAGYGSGGVDISQSTISLTLLSSIISGNTMAAGGQFSDLTTKGGLLYSDFSAIGSSNGHPPVLTVSSTPTPGTNRDYGANLVMDALTDNGSTVPQGPTGNTANGQTIPLLSGSDAVNTGVNDFLPNFPTPLASDQRGASFPRVIGGSADIGAFERTPGAPSASGGPYVSITKANFATQNPYLFTVVYNGDSPLVFTDLDDNDITVTGPNSFSANAKFVSSVPAGPGNASKFTATYKLDAPGGVTGWLPTDNGVYTITANAGQVNLFGGGPTLPTTKVGTFQVAIGQNFTVTNTGDSGAGSLRQAVLDANASIADDVVVFDGSFTSTIQQIKLATEIPISDSLVVQGPGANFLTVLGSGSNRHFNLGSSAAAPATILVNLQGMTLSKGSSTAGGGAIEYGNENLTLTDMQLSGNSGFNGGALAGIDQAAGILNLVRTAVVNNTAGGNGGAIYNSGGSAGILTMKESTISGNSAAGNAGFFYGFNWNAASCTMTISNSTITQNTGANTGGIQVNSSAVHAVLKSTILSGNVNTSGTSPDLITITLDTDYCAIGDATGSTLGTRTNDIADGSPLGLLGLAFNGGPTLNHGFAAGSLLIDAGSNPNGDLVDQRGLDREVIDGEPDIGAIERVPGPPGATVGPLPTVDINNGPLVDPYIFTVTYSADSKINVSTVGENGVTNDDILVTGPNGFSVLATFNSIDDNTDGTPRIATYQIAAPGGNGWDFADNGTYTVNMRANEVADTDGLFVAAGVLGTFNVQFAGTYTVTNSNDSGDGSLRAAILGANTPNTIDTIVFSSTFFNTPRTITLETALPGITDEVVINGPGQGFATVDAGNASSKSKFRIFDISTLPLGTNFTLSNITLTGGSTTGNGGAILADGEDIILTNVTIENCTAAEGGAVHLGPSPATGTFAGTLTMDGSTIRNNRALTGDGGAIQLMTDGELTIRTSTLSGNVAAGEGGVAYFYDDGALRIERSTISGNTANGALGGGGIYFWGDINGNGYTISNSTFAGNAAPNGSGGALDFDSVLINTPLIANSTFVGNTAKTGGAIARTAGTGKLTIISTVVAGNTATASGPDISFGTAQVSISKSAVGTDPLGSLIDYGTNDNIAFGTPLLLGPLTLANGGPTATMKPQPGSPLLNNGVNSFPLTPDLDQIGFDRNDNGTTQTDIGAVEVQSTSAPVFSSFLVNQGFGATFATQRSRLINIVVNFAAPIDAAQFQTLGNVTLTSTGGPSNGNVVNTGNGLIVSPASGPTSTITLTFANTSTPGFIDNASLADGLWRLAISTASYTSTTGDPALRRLFGDFDNNGTVEGAIDFPAFGNDFNGTFGPPSSAFDFNNDGTVEGSIDFPAFGNNFNVTL